MRRMHPGLQGLLPSASVVLPMTAVPRGTVPRSAMQSRVNQQVRRSGQITALGLPANWGWGLDATSNPVPVDGSNNAISLPTGDQAGTGPSTPVPLDAQGYAVCPSPMPSTGVMIGLTVLGLVVGYGLASTQSGGTMMRRLNPIRYLNPMRHLRRLRHHMRRAHRF